MTGEQLETTLRELPRIGRCVKDRGYRQIWRFEVENQPYYLKFYPWRAKGLRGRILRYVRGSPALNEFFRLQWLMKAGVAAPRPVAVLKGFRMPVNGPEAPPMRGDAVVLEGIEPSVGLDEYLNRLQLQGRRMPGEEHQKFVRQIIEIVYRLGVAGLGHNDLHLGNFLLKEGRLHLIDAHAVHKDGLRMRDLLQLAHGVRGYATRTDLLRGWMALKFAPASGSKAPGEAEIREAAELLPKSNRISRIWFWRGQRRAMKTNRYFGRLRLGGWSGHYFKQFKYPRRWSAASGMAIGREDWQVAWPKLLEAMEADRLEVLKRTRSGSVLGGEIELSGMRLDFILKRPNRKHLHRYVNEIGRGGRARRAWKKAWALIVRDLPTAWPLLIMERRVLGYVVDQVIVFERLEGPTLDQCDLDALGDEDRRTLFHRAGRLLRLMEQEGLYHYDAKSSNWIIRADEMLGPFPMLVDVDGIRRVGRRAVGILRLLRAMRNHSQYTPADSLSLCRGYAPFSPIGQMEAEAGGDEGEPTPLILPRPGAEGSQRPDADES